MSFSSLSSSLLTPLSQIDMLKVYVNYVNNFDNAIATLTSLKEKNSDFAKWLRVRERERERERERREEEGKKDGERKEERRSHPPFLRNFAKKTARSLWISSPISSSR
jgi:hypothetical protein